MDDDTENEHRKGALAAATRKMPEALRLRHDGWTPARQDAFIAALAEYGSVTDACKVVGLSTTSAYRARSSLRGFRNRWSDALDTARPKLEEIAYARAVEGVREPVFQGGKLVGHKTKYSDSLLKMMIQRGATDTTARGVKRIPIEVVEAELLRQIDAVAKRVRRQEREATLAWAERMAAKGFAP